LGGEKEKSKCWRAYGSPTLAENLFWWLRKRCVMVRNKQSFCYAITLVDEVFAKAAKQRIRVSLAEA
jgi:hypothetical protein